MKILLEDTMDDIYFSDKKNKNKKIESSATKRIITDKFTDNDYDSADIKSNAQVSAANKSKNFKVNIPDFDMDIPEPGHITAPSKDIYSSSRQSHGKWYEDEISTSRFLSLHRNDRWGRLLRKS